MPYTEAGVKVIGTQYSQLAVPGVEFLFYEWVLVDISCSGKELMKKKELRKIKDAGDQLPMGRNHSLKLDVEKEEILYY